MRVLTFQSKDVLNVLENNDRYEINKHLCREPEEYKLELDKYNYSSPVWVFAPKGMNKRNLKDANKFSKEDFIDAVKFMDFKCEMSLYDTLELNNFYLLELEVNENELKPGLTHNGCSYVYVINGILKEQLKAIYQLEYDRNREQGWYYPKVKVIKKLCDNPLFDKDFLCASILNTKNMKFF